MNNMKKFFLFFVMVLFSVTAFSQDKKKHRSISGANGLQNLFGKWTASCPIEWSDYATLHFCALCNSMNDSTKKQKPGNISDIQMTFENDSIRFSHDGASKAVAYTIDHDTQSVQFTFKNKEYIFRTFYSGDKVILENSDGRLMVLERND